MDNRTFHPFPKLPTELRLLIWEFAIQPRAGYRGSTQYFHWQCCTPLSLAFYGDRRLHVTKRLPEISSDYPSAYLWDAGLSRACQESNTIARKSLHGPLTQGLGTRSARQEASGNRSSLWDTIHNPYEDLFIIRLAHVVQIHERRASFGSWLRDLVESPLAIHAGYLRKD